MLKHCQICGVPLVEKGDYGHVPNHLSRHHLYPIRFKKDFNPNEIKEIFGIEKPSDIGEFCYECHEEIIHNIVLNKKIIASLTILFKGKSKKQKIKIFHKIFNLGLKNISNER